MPKRTKSYDEYFAKKLQDIEYARDYILVLVREENMSVEEVLIQLAESMGQKEFADMTGTTKQRINAFVTGRLKLTIPTIERFLKPFGLEIDIGLKEAS